MRTLLIVLFTFCAQILLAGSPHERFAEANALYESGSFAESLVIYEEISAEYSGFELWFNAGNAAYKSGELGKSVLYYERAKKIDPTNDDLLVNLAIANDKVADRIQALPSLGVENVWSIMTASTRLNTWSWAAVIFNALGFLLIGVYILVSKGTLRRIMLIAGVVLVGVGLSTYLLSRASYSELKASEQAVILSDKVDVRTSPNENGSAAFVLHEGTKCTIRQDNGDWLEIKIANGSVGWILKTDLAVI